MNALPPELKGRKVSEVFMDYINPFLKNFLQAQNEIPSLEQLNTIFRIPWCIWNALVVKEFPNHKIDYWASLKLLANNSPPEIKQLLEFMKERKLTMFNQYKYMLGRYKLDIDKKNNEIKLSLEARSTEHLEQA